MATDATGTASTVFSLPKYNTATDAPSGKGLNAIIDDLDSKLNTKFPHSFGSGLASDEVPVWNGSAWVYQKITNANVDSAAAIEMSKLSATGYFHVYRSSTQSINQNAATKVQFDTEEADEEGWYANASDFRYLPLIAGKYLLTARLAANPGSTAYADGIRLQIFIYKNGVVNRRLAIIRNGAATDDWILGGTTLVTANGTTDYFEVFFEHNDAAARNLGTGTDRVYFEGLLVGT